MVVRRFHEPGVGNFFGSVPQVSGSVVNLDLGSDPC